MSDEFSWNPTYNIGVEEIDNQHRNLFAIAARLREEMPADQLQQELMSLYRHTREHFSAEEQLMRDCGYPDYKYHRGEHDALLDRLNIFSRAVVKDPTQLPRLRQFLADWISKHIGQCDRLIAEYLDPTRSETSGANASASDESES